MEFTPRIKQILQILLKEDAPVPEQQIADEIGVSKRTVQREFEYMESGVREYHLLLHKKKNAGIWLAGDEMDKTTLKHDLEELSGTDTADKQIRRKYLICELLRERVPRKLYYFSEMLGVSEATVSKDLEAVSKWFADCRIQLIRRQGYGITLSGTEKDYRAALQKFIKENVDDEAIRRLLYKGGSAIVDMPGEPGSRNIYELLSSEILGKVSRTLQEMDEPRLRQMEDNSYIGLILHITIAIDRILKGEVLENQNVIFSSCEPDEDSLLAEEIISRLEEVFGLEIPKGETDFILLHIKGAKMSYSESQEEKKFIGTESMLDLADQMIDAFDSEVSYELKCDEEFIQGLLLHLEPTLIRLKHDMHIYNPLLAEIKEEYAEVFFKTMQAAKVLEAVIGKEVPEEEVGYLAMHFGAALVKASDRKARSRTVTIGVICASGFGVARLMMTKLANCFKTGVEFKTYGRDEVTPYISARTDFFVSSLALEEPGMDSVRVSPLITAGDLNLIRAKVEEYSHMPPRQQESDFTRQLDEINQMTTSIKSLIRRYKNYTLPEAMSLEEMLGRLARLGTESPVSAAVLKADLWEREQLMSQIFPDLEFALFHCRTRAVREASFYTAIPETGSCFTDPDLKKIRAAVVLLLPQQADSGFEQELLGHISSSFVEDRQFLTTIFDGTEEKVRAKLQKILKAYFNQYINKL